jgi:hypothetical protein
MENSILLKKNKIDSIVSIEGKNYFTVKGFAKITKKEIQLVRYLISHGNRIRKLKYIKYLNNTLIPFSELIEFPFTCVGPGKDIYHYDEEGRRIKK